MTDYMHLKCHYIRMSSSLSKRRFYISYAVKWFVPSPGKSHNDHSTIIYLQSVINNKEADLFPSHT